jgi:IS30 family transposase
VVRRYLPHRTDLQQVAQEDLDAIASDLKERPCKCLEFLTLAEVLCGHTVAPKY